MLTPQEAAAAVAQRTAERDQIQANLLELDGSFGRRLLAGARLAGASEQQWEQTTADLTSVWAMFTAYAAVVQRAADLLDGSRRFSAPVLGELTQLLTLESVELAGDQVPLARRQLTGSGQPTERVSLADSVQRMTTAFGRIAAVVSSAEAVWHEVSRRLDEIAAVLGPAARQADGLADGTLTGMLLAADTEVRRLRERLNADPLSYWQDGRVDSSGLDQLMRQARAAATQTAELARLRSDADHRIAQTAAAVATAQACEDDARAVRAEAAQKILAAEPQAIPAATDSLAGRLAGLDALKATGRWPALAAELAAIEQDAASATAAWERAGVAARALLDRRRELRGLLDAYQAKAGRLGAAENADVVSYYERARDLLWSAPCDLVTAGEALQAYQQAVLALQRGKA